MQTLNFMDSDSIAERVYEEAYDTLVVELLMDDDVITKVFYDALDEISPKTVNEIITLGYDDITPSIESYLIDVDPDFHVDCQWDALLYAVEGISVDTMRHMINDHAELNHAVYKIVDSLAEDELCKLPF